MRHDEPPRVGVRSEKQLIMTRRRAYLTKGDHTTSKDWRRAMLMAPLGTPPTDSLLVPKRASLELLGEGGGFVLTEDGVVLLGEA